MTFRYDDESHTYWNGERQMLSVTEVLRAGGLLDMMRADEAAMWAGEATHKAVELWFKNTLDEGSVAPIIRPKLEAVIEFAKNTGFVMTASEVPRFNALMNVGTKPDLEGEFPDGSLAIVELKSGTLSPWVQIQTAGQDIVMGGDKTRTRWGLGLAKGRPSIRQHTGTQDHAMFLSCLNIANWKDRHQKTWRTQ